MDSKISYNDVMELVENEVKLEIPAFKALVPSRKLQHLVTSLKNYCNYRRSADRYSRLEKNNSTYAKLKADSEYLEILSGTRLRFKLQMCDDDVLQKYATHLRSILEDALIEKDTKKRFKMYDYICAGCLHCKVDNEQVMQEIEEIHNRAKDIISQIPTM